MRRFQCKSFRHFYMLKKHHHMTNLYTKKRPLYIYVSLLQKNTNSYFIQLFCFPNVDHLSNVMHQTKIHSLVISANNNAESISTQISKVTKSISRVSSIFLNCRRTCLSHWTNTLLNCYECQVYSLSSRPLALMCNLKVDVTERRSRPCIFTRRRYLSFDASGSKHFAEVSYCLRRFFNRQAACSIPKSRSRHFCRHLDMVFR